MLSEKCWEKSNEKIKKTDVPHHKEHNFKKVLRLSRYFLLIFATEAVTIEAEQNVGGAAMDNYGADIISITDENGEEFELEILATVTYRGAEYLALAPIDADDESEELEVSILRSAEDENGEPILEAVEDDDELEAVYDLLLNEMLDDEDED